jgi:hypothetical protein
VNLRRILAAGTVALATTAVLTACGFNYPTDRINQLTVGSDYRNGNVDVLNAAVVSSAGNGGTLVATFVNNTDQEQQLTGITGAGKVTAVDVTPLTIEPQALVNLADQGGYAVTGTFGIGEYLNLRFEFGDGTTAVIEVPVVADDGDWQGLDTATPPPSPSPSGSPSAPGSPSGSASPTAGS